MLKLAAIGIDMFASTVTHRRFAAGGYVDGVWAPGSAVETEIRATVQATTPQTLRDLPEGIREDASWTIWSRSELRGPEGGQPDEIVWRGETYRVTLLWPRLEAGFYKAVLGRREAAR
jgi:hypothetical protein